MLSDRAMLSDRSRCLISDGTDNVCVAKRTHLAPYLVRVQREHPDEGIVFLRERNLRANNS